MKKTILIIAILFFSCVKKDNSKLNSQNVIIENKELNSNFRKIILNYQKTYPVKNPRNGNIYIYSLYFYINKNDTIFQLTRTSAGIADFLVKNNYLFGTYSDSDLSPLIILDSFKLSSKFILKYKRLFPDNLIWKKKSFPESITPLSTYKLKKGIPVHLKTDTIWNQWD